MKKSVFIIVTGSRSINDQKKISDILVEKLKDILLAPSLTEQDLDITLVHGDAEGVDKICGEWATAHNIAVKAEPTTDADWKLYGNGAGNVRNLKMLNETIGKVKETGGLLFPVAFWDGSSTGTKHMIDSIKKAGYNCDTHLLGTPKTKRLM